MTRPRTLRHPAGRTLRIAHVFPDALNIYGDIGNIRVLCRRAEWRGIEVDVVPVGAGPVRCGDVDLVMIGGGQDSDQARIADDLVAHKRQWLRRGIDDGLAVLAVCGGYQLLGRHYFDVSGRTVPGMGLVDLVTEAGAARSVGNVVLNAHPSLGLQPDTIVGFENHAGRTVLGAGLEPLGRVVVGGGNNDRDDGEGVLTGRVVGTYVHGSLLPKNPALADWLIAAALAHRNGEEKPVRLGPLDDTWELAAHQRARQLAIAQRGSRPR